MCFYHSSKFGCFLKRCLEDLGERQVLPRLLLCLCLCWLLAGCNNRGEGVSEMVWESILQNTGTHSSPRVADLNGDGILDIVLGAGGNEFHKSDTGVVAINGQNGELLWRATSRDQLFGSACFLDITADAVPDVIISGRQASLVAVNGKTGELIWRFFPEGDSLYAGKAGFYNFYSPQLVPDQDGDGLSDLLIANGGDVFAPPYEKNRPAGKIMVISSANGKILASAPVPDGKETYMTALVHDFEGDGTHSLIFGTGGETIGGHLYKGKLQDLMANSLEKAMILHSSEGSGYTAPPVLVDVNGDGIADVVGNSYGGEVFALDGRTHEKLWSYTIMGAAINTTPAVGYFNQDDTPDFFISAGKGIWPDVPNTYQVALDGKNGHALFQSDTGCFNNGSPIVVDITGDGVDEVLLQMNFGNSCYYGDMGAIKTQVMAFDIKNQKIFPFSGSYYGKNLSSTPVIADLNQDGYLDLVYCVLSNTREYELVKNLMVVRERTAIPSKRGSLWNGYLGSLQNGYFPTNKKVFAAN
jgi:outer membrane protein assembly factor BamB